MIDVMKALEEIIKTRRDNPVDGSYTSSLFTDGEDEIVKKVGEEAVEIIIAAKSQGNQRVIEETADLIYHILVLLVERDLSWQHILNELEKRQHAPAAHHQ